MQLWLLLSSIAGAVLIVAWRARETTAPVTARKILIPPLGMSTGLGMFAYAPTRIPVAWGLSALAMGVFVFSYPLIKSSTLTQSGESIVLQRSPAFLWILLGLLAVRFAARAYVEQFVSPLQTGSIFFLLALGMIVRWRAQMFLEYRKLVTAQAPVQPSST